MLRYKSKKLCAGFIWGKLQNSDEWIKRELNKWRDIPCLWIGRLHMVKLLVLPNVLCRVSVVPANYFVDINKLILKFIWKGKRPRIANTILKKNEVEGLILQTLRLSVKLQWSRQCTVGRGWGRGIWMKAVKTWKGPDAGKDWRWEEKGTTEDELVGWHHRLDGHELESTLGVGDGRGGAVCCSPWGRKESDMTEWLNWTELSQKIQTSSFN